MEEKIINKDDTDLYDENYIHSEFKVNYDQIQAFMTEFNINKKDRIKIIMYLYKNIDRYGDMGKPKKMSLTQYWLNNYADKINNL